MDGDLTLRVLVAAIPLTLAFLILTWILLAKMKGVSDASTKCSEASASLKTSIDKLVTLFEPEEITDINVRGCIPCDSTGSIKCEVCDGEGEIVENNSKTLAPPIVRQFIDAQLKDKAAEPKRKK